METLQAQILKLTKKHLQLVSDLEDKFVEALSKDIERGARKNFNSARESISGDDPTVIVTRVKNSPKSATIVCGGEQVLFAEFGAGYENLYYTNGLSIDVLSTRSWKYIGNEAVEIAPRPNGIVELGEYGNKHGRESYWIRPTHNGRKGIKESDVLRDGFPRSDVLWTEGTRPIRALWRARNNALNHLNTGRLKIK